LILALMVTRAGYAGRYTKTKIKNNQEVGNINVVMPFVLNFSYSQTHACTMKQSVYAERQHIAVMCIFIILQFSDADNDGSATPHRVPPPSIVYGRPRHLKGLAADSALPTYMRK
jgi:hypothetical protein